MNVINSGLYAIMINMKTEELISELEKLNIPNHWYLIGDKGITDNKTVLRSKDSKWTVYYSERGGRFEESFFDSEEDACKELLSRMTNKMDRRSGEEKV